ncbi:Nuclear transport factor 2 family protein [Sulfidibacter corallicola]|uniref:Nuclear transport factor 2 family protein n=1 Tax=Sulfidibacter corallicola TaxID=2818388 RepID=A0A8A4TYU6_SULCO|nr:nuclear transport factor 2 family protein [Sulfidibacter corallicola]QTD51695.1 nuclear transport factor 2 family protein [Sulfidibacter corallicola]
MARFQAEGTRDSAHASTVLRPFLDEAFTSSHRHHVTLDGKSVAWLRHSRVDGADRGLGGEHLSFVLDPLENRLLGLTRLVREHVDLALPSKDEAAAVARDFLQRYAPDLVPQGEVLWIDRHDETIRVDGAARTVPGMKVKHRNHADGLYFWVIVGGNGEVITFERDIFWIDFPGRRRTEKWLHDGWLEESGHVVGQRSTGSLVLADELAVRAAIHDYFLGTYVSDRDLMSRAFMPESHVTGFLGDEGHDETATAFIERVMTGPSLQERGESFQKEMLRLDLVGRVALVEARVLARGMVFRDLLTLHKSGDRWAIRHKSYYTDGVTG